MNAAGLILAIIYSIGVVTTYIIDLVLTNINNKKNSNNVSSGFLQEISEAVIYGICWPVVLPSLIGKLLTNKYGE